ncbi:MAG: nucleoside triphosphate pyrophosphohydrolase [Hyphomicrobiales bacterium]|nr:MAG: nucleoside triphosphate pyrophosphohydrolase [Hyphomicrobiales bacterium]
MKPSRDIARLLEIMAALRTPVTGCPWDLEQDFSTIAPYTIEEAYEVADAIHRGDTDDICDELGDLLLQVVFHSRMAEEKDIFDFGDVVHAITRKMIRRHPHVFGDQKQHEAGMSKAIWDAIKAEEKAEKAARHAAHGTAERAPSLLDDVPISLPALMRAEKLQRRAGTVGFDWNSVPSVMDKMHEELGEIEVELNAPEQSKDRIEDEIGDLLFVVANLARHLHIDPEKALQRTNEKFRTRFRHIETRLGEQGSTLQDASLDEMEALWQEAKTAPKGK